MALPTPLSPYDAVSSLTQLELLDLASRYRAAHKTYTWSLVVGLLLFWPLLILTYQENKNKKEILARVSALGVDPTIWKNTAV
jgi:hypothetical protein